MLKSNSRNTNWIVDPFTHGKIDTKSISIRGVFCNFSLTPMSKWIKRLWIIYKYISSLFKINFNDNKVRDVPENRLQKLRCPVVAFQNKPSPAGKKTRLTSSKDNIAPQSFPLSTKRKVRILLNFPFFQRWILNFRTTRNFGLGEEVWYRTVPWRRRPSWTKSITWRTRFIICFICKVAHCTFTIS